MEGLREVVQVVLSLGAGFLLIPAWLLMFDGLGLNGWGFFDSGRPVFIGAGEAYWLLGFLPAFRHR